MSVTVAFLARGEGAGLPALRAFLDSYFAHPAGMPHRLVILVKGWDGVPGRDAVNVLAERARAEVLELPDDGYDWGAYFRLAEVAETEFLFLMNSHSRILHANWLAHLMAQGTKPGVGLVGCTGSWGSISADWQLFYARFRDRIRRRRWLDATRQVKNVVAGYLHRGSAYLRRFPQYPNPHVRSNAFLVRTGLFRAFSKASPWPTTKTDAHALESGRRCLSRFVERRGLSLLLCDADGRAYGPKEWRESRTFFWPGQPGLLIADNQTEDYLNAPVEDRRNREGLAWGRLMTADDASS